MNTKQTHIVLITLIILTLLAGIILYPFLPDQIASHWNMAGEADGYMGKLWGVLFIPLLMIVFFALYWGIPYLDPLKKNIDAFKHSYNLLWIVLFLFFTYVFGLQLAWNMGLQFHFGMAMIPAFALLLYTIGGVIQNAKQNWFVGIRTPWTLSNSRVWDKTHQLGGTLFKIAGVLALGGLFAPDAVAIAFLIVPIMGAALGSVVYSYVVYRKIQK